MRVCCLEVKLYPVLDDGDSHFTNGEYEMGK